MKNKTEHLLFDDNGVHKITPPVKSLNKICLKNGIVLPPIDFYFKLCDSDPKQLSFHKIQPLVCQQNFELIDSQLPQILAAILLITHNANKDLSINELFKILKATNPLNYDLSFGHPMYENKIIHFLESMIYGCTTTQPWNGQYLQTITVVIKENKDNEINCHVYNRYGFIKFLLDNLMVCLPVSNRNDTADTKERLITIQLSIKYQTQKA